ncbi:uncharacterized protein LOC131310799 [Rhododendron vialii]|uniref:uncharacterized protein LOC131310799 n=1 Tax=Rhododendron vialii TaxID=182163 RepID=UPI00265F320C|nr:uncharacterized protein LOC131310799 [Rhododendron vialii]
MYQLPETAKNLAWHANERESDGKLRHPANSPAWKLVDHMWPDFGAEPRNLRLAISADGINPHSSLSSRYSCWPVVMVNYNLPPWLCMKRKFMMLTLLISGPQQPGNDIDVFLAPLIDDLKLLWDVGVEAYDAYRQQHFNLRVVLLWTINDFPAYGNLSGCKVKGYGACPICSEGTCSRRLKHGKKNIYVGHRKFLPINHSYRRLKKAFDGKQELGLAPSPLSGEEVLRKVQGIKLIWGKKKKTNQQVLVIKVVGRRSPYSLILSIGSTCLSDTYWMLCTLRRMCVRVSLVRCLTFRAKQRMELMLVLILWRRVYDKSWHHRLERSGHTCRQHAIHYQMWRKEDFAQHCRSSRSPKDILQI